jgi:hypothetical protein
VWFWPDGGLEVRHIFEGKPSTVFTTETLALKKGVGATNHIELDLQPRDATLVINGTEVQRFRGIQPKDGGVIGISATSPEDAPATFSFDNFIVTLAAPNRPAGISAIRIFEAAAGFPAAASKL